MMYIKDFIHEQSGIETLEKVAFIGIGAVLLGVILAIYINLKNSTDHVKDTVGKPMTEIEDYVSDSQSQ